MDIGELKFIYWGLVIVVLAFALVVLWKLWKVDLSGLVIEPETQKASLARFQFLLFTFLIAGLYIVFCLDTGDFIEIPSSVLALMGISGGSFIVAKGIAANAKTEQEKTSTSTTTSTTTKKTGKKPPPDDNE